MPRTKPRPCPAGLHQLTPDIRSCLLCQSAASLEHIAGVVAAVEPGLELDVIRGAISSAARSAAQLRRLREHLAANPSALTTGASTVPNVVGRLAHELARCGARAVILPKCLDCRRAKPLLSIVAGGRVCSTCFSARGAEACSRCGKTKPVCGRAPGGAAVCPNCWRRDPARAALCKVCGKAGPVSVRDPDGQVTCTRCYRATLRECGGCGEPGRIVSRLSSTPLCVACYGYPERPCGRCGQVRQVGRRARAGEPELCVGCARPPIAICGNCGVRRRCHFVAEGRPVCIRCSPLRAVACAHCGDVRPVTANWAEGPVCARCYVNALRRRGTCTSCGEERRLVDPPGPGSTRCASCAGVAVAHVCGRCGIEDKLYESGLCPRCVLADRATDLLAGDDGVVPGAMAPIYTAIVDSPSALHALGWLLRGRSGALLIELVKTGVPPTHAMLDALPPTRSAAHLRQLLVASGALPPHQGRLRQLERWLDASASATESEADRRLLRAYATWVVLARLRRRSGGEDITTAAAGHARQRFRAAQRFLLWLQERGTDAGRCTQETVDSWLSSGARSRYDIREFVLWAVGTGAMTGVEVPAKASREGPQLDEDDRWSVVRRLLHDDSLDIVDRVAGAFVLLFAQKLTTIATLTVDDVVIAGDRVRSASAGIRSRCLLPSMSSSCACAPSGPVEPSVPRRQTGSSVATSRASRCLQAGSASVSGASASR